MPLGLFAGRSRTPTRKKSPTLEDRDGPRFVGGGGADTLAKGHLHELGLEDPQREAYFGALRTLLPWSGQEV